MMLNVDQADSVWFEYGLPPLKRRLKSSPHHDILKGGTKWDSEEILVGAGETVQW